MITSNPVIEWSDDNSAFELLGDKVTSHSKRNLDTLEFGMIVAIRRVSWGQFIHNIAAAITLATASDNFKTIIGIVVLISMHKIKAQAISDEVSFGFEDALEKVGDKYYLNIKAFSYYADDREIQKALSWFIENEIGYLSDDKQYLIINNYTVGHLTII